MLQGLCVPGRVSVGWFQPQQPDLYHHSRFPVWILQDAEQNLPFYGFPEFGQQPGEAVCRCLPVVVAALLLNDMQV